MPAHIGMAVSSASHRRVVFGRATLPWLTGVAALLLRSHPLELAPASPCPGLLELIGIAAVRSHPDLTAGVLFGAMHATAIVAGVAMFVRLVSRRNVDMAVAATTGLALGLSPMFASTLAPPWEAAAVAVCAAAALLIGPLCDRLGRSAAAPLAMLGVAVIGALLVPAWTALAAIGAGATVLVSFERPRFIRWVQGAAISAGIVCAVLAVLSVLPQNASAGGSRWSALAACTWPVPATARVLAIPGTIGWLLGPFALALSALGLVVEVQREVATRRLMVAALGLACLPLAIGNTLGLQIVLAPCIVGLWFLVASGLREITSRISRGPVLRIAGAIFLLLVPTLQAARFSAEERDDWERPNGHESATLAQVTAGLNSVSPDATFVEEDSVVDLLLRAAVFGGRRSAKRFVVGSRQTASVVQALTHGPVYAFPKGREDLSKRGFTTAAVEVTMRLPGDDRAKITGLAVVTGSRPCQTVGADWIDLAGGFPSGRMALAADTDAAHGPLVLFLGGSNAVEPHPDAWPARTTRGFRFAVFDRRTGNPSERLEEARLHGLATEHRVLTMPFVMRLLLHRTPRAPLALAVTLGAPFPVAVARLQAGVVETGHLMLCDAPEVDIAPFGSRAP
ncbi:MAG: hypothetical protein ABJA98_16505 [Acidobacteriota bacterium]